MSAAKTRSSYVPQRPKRCSNTGKKCIYIVSIARIRCRIAAAALSIAPLGLHDVVVLMGSRNCLSTRERHLRGLWQVTAGLLKAGHPPPCGWDYSIPPDKDEGIFLEENDLTK
jgi:hypothetical protein